MLLKKENKIHILKQTTIKQKQRIPFLKFFLTQKPILTTHKPRQELKPDHNTKKIPLCKKKTPYGIFIKKEKYNKKIRYGRD